MGDLGAWMRRRVRTGWLLLATGTVVVFGSVTFGANAFPGWFGAWYSLGIVAVGIGSHLLGRYRSAVHDPATARRVIAVDRDERTASIKARSGRRAWVVSAGINWIGFMWAEMSGHGGPPALARDLVLWFLLVALAVPFCVYAGSVAVEQRRS